MRRTGYCCTNTRLASAPEALVGQILEGRYVVVDHLYDLTYQAYDLDALRKVTLRLRHERRAPKRPPEPAREVIISPYSLGVAPQPRSDTDPAGETR